MEGSGLTERERRALAEIEDLMRDDDVLERQLRTMRLDPEPDAHPGPADLLRRPRALLLALLAIVCLGLLIAATVTTLLAVVCAFVVTWLVTLVVAVRLPGTARRRRTRERTSAAPAGQARGRRRGGVRAPGAGPRGEPEVFAVGARRHRPPPRHTVTGSAGRSPGAGGAAANSAALLLGRAAPNTRGLPGGECPVKAVAHHRAPLADRLGAGLLPRTRARRADREEQFRILLCASGASPPAHRLDSFRRKRSGVSRTMP